MRRFSPLVKKERSFYTLGMPRVTDEHRERRRQQILDAARRCFIRRGFHQTTMSDILGEAELSAGAVYGYFRGKDEIIAAIAQTFIDQITGLLEPMAEHDPPPSLPEASERLMGQLEDVAFGPNGFAFIAPQVWAEALHNESIHALLNAKYAKILGAFTQLVRAQQRAGMVRADADPANVAKVILGSSFGYVMQRVLIGNMTRADYWEGLAAITGADLRSSGAAEDAQ